MGEVSLSDIAMLLVSLGVILLGAEAFTNGIEWLGQKLKLGAGAVGSILAAVGTALPETMVPIIAIFGKGNGTEGADIGIGAILGAPFMLATLAFFITGLAALLFRRNNRPLQLEAKVVRRDLRFFLIVYTYGDFRIIFDKSGTQEWSGLGFAFSLWNLCNPDIA